MKRFIRRLNILRRSRLTVCLRHFSVLLPVFLFVGTLTVFYKALVRNAETSSNDLPFVHQPLEWNVMETVGSLSASRSGNSLSSRHPQRWWLVLSLQGPIDTKFCELMTRQFLAWTILLIDESLDMDKGLNFGRCQILSRTLLDLEVKIMNISSISKGYLYAIKSGAEFIHVSSTATNADVLRSILPTPYEETDTRLVVMDHVSNIFNAGSHFGCGQPGSGSSTQRMPNSTSYFLTMGSSYTSQIYTSSIAHSSLSSSLSYSDRKSTTLTCDPLAPTVTLSRGLFTDIVLDGATFHRDSFWALPTLQPSRAGRSSGWLYIVQRLIWEIGGTVTVVGGVPSDINISTDIQLNQLSEMSQFVCDDSSDFISCVRGVLARPALFDVKNSVLLWLAALETIGYKFPILLTRLKTDPPQDTLNHQHPVVFNPIFRFRERSNDSNISERKRKFIPVSNLKLSQALHELTCVQKLRFDVADQLIMNKKTKKSDALKKMSRKSFLNSDSLAFPWTQFSNIVLVVVFNEPIYAVIPYVELLYRPFFPYLVYCGPRLPDASNLELEGYRITFVSYHPTPGHLPGSFNYDCVRLASAAVRSDQAVDGFLMVADDLLLLLPMFTDAPRDLVWFLPHDEVRVANLTTQRECLLGSCDFHPHWPWWEKYGAATIQALTTLSRTDHGNDLFRNCHQRLALANGGLLRANRAFSDIYYIPASLANDFGKIATIFRDHQVFLEIAIPTILQCLDPNGRSWPHLNGLQVWTIEHRDDVWMYFNRPNLFGKRYFHPTKWSRLANRNDADRTLSTNSTSASSMATSLLVDVYCDSILPYLHDPLNRLPAK